jgi:hypothetical protein
MPDISTAVVERMSPSPHAHSHGTVRSSGEHGHAHFTHYHDDPTLDSLHGVEQLNDALVPISDEPNIHGSHNHRPLRIDPKLSPSRRSSIIGHHRSVFIPQALTLSFSFVLIYLLQT